MCQEFIMLVSITFPSLWWSTWNNQLKFMVRVQVLSDCCFGAYVKIDHQGEQHEDFTTLKQCYRLETIPRTHRPLGDIQDPNGTRLIFPSFQQVFSKYGPKSFPYLQSFVGLRFFFKYSNNRMLLERWIIVS